MANKMTDEWYEELDECKFYSFLIQMNQCIGAYAEMTQTLMDQFSRQAQPSWRSLYLMRQVSIDVEKLGKMFREKTLDAEKDKPFEWSKVYKKRNQKEDGLTKNT